MASPLQREFDYYLAHRAELLKQYVGQVIVIKDEKVLGAYPDQPTAVAETIKTHALGTFLVQKVDPGEASYSQTFHSPRRI